MQAVVTDMVLEGIFNSSCAGCVETLAWRRRSERLMSTFKVKKSGQSFVELVCGLLFLVPIFLALFDIAICFIADSANESVCRDAARAASAGVPQDFTPTGGQTVAADSMKRAQAVCDHVYKSGGYIVGPKLAKDLSGPQSLVPPDPTTGGQWGGTYRVVTTMLVNLPASIPGLTPTQVTLSKAKEFTITRTEKPVYSY